MRSSFPAMPQLDSAPLLLAGGRTPYASAQNQLSADKSAQLILHICAWLIVYHSTYPDTYRRFVSIRILEVWTAVSSQYPVSLL